MKKLLGILLLLFLFNPAVFAHQNHVAHLGTISFPTSGSKAAQPLFERGVMWLHSFEYNEARLEFQRARKIDPSFVMAYWGELMTYNHPLWSEQDQASALKVLVLLGPTAEERVAKAQTPIEKGFINAINLLYGKGDKKTRDAAYAEAMRQLAKQNPDDDEIASFYALSLLGATEGERDFQTYMQAAAIEEEIYTRNPNHPGALHYLIHAYDDPVHASLGLRPARTYAKAAPDASHALHMPSHIFLALGLWDDVITSNKAAWLAGFKQNIAGKPQLFTLDDLHALEWLSYGYLQKQQYKIAYQLTKTMQDIAEKTNSPMAKWYYAFMRAAYIIESKDWHVDLKSLDMSTIELSAKATDMYVNALIALYQHPDKTSIKNAKNILAELRQAIPKKIPTKTYTDYFTAVIPSGITAAKIMALELAGQIQWNSGNNNEAIKLLKQATQLEANMSFGYGPPIPVKPSYELLAEMLFQNKKYAEAYRQYVFALKRMPNRLESTRGLKITTEKLNHLGLAVPDGIGPYFNKLLLPDYYH